MRDDTTAPDAAHSTRPDAGQPPTEQQHGRPTGSPDEDGLRAGIEHHEAPTEAPEEQGHEPEVELAPGSDL